MKTNESRILTITAKVNGRMKADNTASYHPVITLSGLWLDEAGFHCGEMVKVDIVNGKILIDKIK